MSAGNPMCRSISCCCRWRCAPMRRFVTGRWSATRRRAPWVVLAAKGGVDPTLTRDRYPRVATLPFDAAYKFMATFHRMGGRQRQGCHTLPSSRALRISSPRGPGSAHGPDGAFVPIDRVREPFLAENDRLGAQGLRVMATAQRDFDPKTFDPDADLLPLIQDLQLLAIVGIVDPPRAEARDAIAKAKSAGIRVRMITGDHAITAGVIASQLGDRRRGDHWCRVRRIFRRGSRSAHRRHRCHRPGRAQGQGPPRRHPPAQGQHRGDDRRRRERCTRAQGRRHRGRYGHHRHRGLQGGRRDDLDRRQLRNDRQGRGAGPGRSTTT